MRPQIERLKYHRRLTAQPLNLFHIDWSRRASGLLVELVCLAVNSYATSIRYFQHIDAAQQCGFAGT